jgi:hypothetical protein
MIVIIGEARIPVVPIKKRARDGEPVKLVSF